MVYRFTPRPDGGADEDVTVETRYNADGRILTLAAKNPTTGDQVTKYVYGTTLADSQIARADLLRAEIYPDSDDTADPLGNGPDGLYDRVQYTYNRQGERTAKKDQNGTVHEYTYDGCGRQTAVRITTLGTGVDGSVRRIATTYEVRGMVESITSYAITGASGSSSSSSSSSGSPGDALNQVLFEYDNFGKLVKEYQEHDGTVTLGDGLPTTPYVGYHYDESASGGRFTKGLRPTSVRYPNGRLVHYTYGDSGSIADAMNRIDAIKDDNSGQPGDTLAQYSYLGAGSIVQVDYQEPDLRCDLAHGTGDDPYDGPMDRFGRVTDLLWRNYGAAEDAVRIKHGYDRAGNRLYREDPVAASYAKDFDELYTYDGMYQLVNMERGDLDFTDPDNPVILSKNFAEDWSLDMTGNWSTYKKDEDGDGTWDLDQSRAHNDANEITQIAGASTHVAHDRCGNMTRMPKPDDWNAHFDLTYDAWNRLVKVEDGADTVAEYEYDGRNFRVLKKTYDAGQLDETRHFFYNRRWQCLEERVESGGTLSSYADRHFLWGLRYIDDLVLRDRNADGNTQTGDLGKTGSGLEERLCGLQDPNGNMVAICAPDGTVTERYIYHSYGTRVFITPAFASRGFSNYAWEHLYTGRQYDPETALYHYRNRPYGAELGRFPTQDPIGYGDFNLYRYVRNSPTIGADPSGKWGKDVHYQRTIQWAEKLGFAPLAREHIANADNATDSLSGGKAPIPIFGDQDYHFNRNPGGPDTRDAIVAAYITDAKRLASRTPTPGGSVRLWVIAQHVGIALHAKQDWVAHADYSYRVPKGEEIWIPHNSLSPQKTFGDPGDYPDDPTLDVVGSPDGRATKPYLWATWGWRPQFTWWGGLGFRIQAAEYACYQKAKGPSKRIQLTEKVTNDILGDFKRFLKSPKANADVRNYFLGTPS